MPRWSPDAALRLEKAAVSLFETAGFANTTVPQIAAAAGLTTRTFFRHFADKRDVLFLRDREFPEAIRDFLGSLPPGTGPVETVRSGLMVACREIEQWRSQIARRQAIISKEPLLQERDLLRARHLAAAIEASLVDRQVDATEARTLAAVAVTCFELAVQRWLDGPADSTLEGILSTVWGDVHRVMREL